MLRDEIERPCRMFPIKGNVIVAAGAVVNKEVSDSTIGGGISDRYIHDIK